MERIEPISNEQVRKMDYLEIRKQLGKYTRTLVDTYGLNRRDAFALVTNIEKLGVASNNKRL